MAVQPAPTTGNVQMPGLLRLPLELRLQIYRYLIPTKRILEVSRPRFKYTISCLRPNNTGLDIPEDTHMKDVADFGGCTKSAYQINQDQVSTWGTDRKKNSIFLVCKKISDEALDVMYGENAFRHYLHFDGDLCLKRKFTQANRRRMRMLLLEAEHTSWIGGITPDIAMWSSIIPTLNILRLVAKQPVQGTEGNAPPLEKEMESWFMFMRAFLNCFHHLLGGKLLEVDFNGETETGEVVKECMLGGYREVRCGLSGDLMFQRGPVTVAHTHMPRARRISLSVRIRYSRNGTYRR